jgi:hypothetical protein
MKKQRLTPNQTAWNKEFNRIQRFIKNASKRGFTFDVEIEKPSRVTKKQLEKIRSLKPKELYKEATYIIPETGEEVTGTEGRTYERSQAQLRKSSKYNPPNEINVVLKSVLQQINDWRPDASMRGWLREKKVLHRNELDDMMAAFILSRGENEAALVLQQNAERVNQSIFTILNDSNDESVKIAFTEFATIINGDRPLSISDSENMTNYTEYYV